MTTATHQVALSAGGSVDSPRESRYNNDPCVDLNGAGYTVHARHGTYEVRPTPSGWGVYASDGGCALEGVRVADDAIGAMLGDPQR